MHNGLDIHMTATHTVLLLDGKGVDLVLCTCPGKPVSVQVTCGADRSLICVSCYQVVVMTLVMLGWVSCYDMRVMLSGSGDDFGIAWMGV